MYEILHVKKHGSNSYVFKLLLTMKLTTLLIFTFLFQVRAASQAQITIVDRQITLERVFKEIQKQAGYDFFYNNDLIRNIRPVSLNLHNANLTTVLDASLSGLPIQYKIVENSVVITAKVNTRVAGQPAPVKVEIVVRDENNKPISGVSVVNKSKAKILGMTDMEGKITLNNVEEGDVLIFRYIGYALKTITIGNKKTIELSLEREDSKLDEVSISTGYQVIKPEQSTGSVTIMSHKDYDSRINTVDFLTSLQNRMPGLLINGDIQFEGNSLFQIRGISTINGSRQPLVVIDGFPTELSLATINPNEIESVTVLRDAAAATIYGVRASNGVIVIERKKPKIGKTAIVYRMTYGFTPKENYERYRWDKNGSNAVIEYTKDNNQYIGPTDWSRITDPTFGWLYNYNMPYNILAQKAAGVISADEATRQLEALKTYNNSKSYSDLFLQTATSQTHNLDLSGGSEKATYFITASYNEGTANIIKNGNSRLGLSARTNLKLSKRFSLDLTTNFQQSDNYAAPVPAITTFYPFEHFQDDNGKSLATYFGSRVNPFYNKLITNLGLLDNLYYPIDEVNLVNDKTRVLNNRFTANFYYDLGKGFGVNFGGVYEIANSEMKHLANSSSAEVRQYVNLYTDPSSTGLVYNIPKGDYLRQLNSKRESYTGRVQLNYDKRIARDHAINLIAGVEIRRLLATSGAAAYFGYSDQTLLQRPVNYATIQSAGYSSTYARTNTPLSYNNLFAQTYGDDRFLSGYTNAVYSYKDKYSLTGSMRIDQANLFGSDPKNRYRPSWSVGAGWNIDKEKFVQELAWLNNAKMRAAFGFNGNVAKNALPEVIATSRLNTIDNTINTLNLFSPANSRLRWEQTYNLNLGLDYRIFKNITGNIDYYLKRSIDLLAPNEIDPTRGVLSAIINQSSIKNTGIEVALHADWISSRKFNWNTGLVVSRNNNKVLKVYSYNITPSSPSSAYIIYNTNYLQGYSTGALFNYRFAGIDNTGAILIYDKDGNKKSLNVNDQGINDVDYAGSSIPSYNIGLSNRFDIGSFYLYAMLNYYGGFSTRMPFLDPTAMRPYEGASNYWRKPGDENIPDVMPALKYSPNNRYLIGSDRYTVDGSYFTLGDVTLAYSFRNNGFVKKAGLGNVELRMQGSNLYTFALNKYNYSLATGSYAKSYLTPTYTMSLQVNF